MKIAGNIICLMMALMSCPYAICADELNSSASDGVPEADVIDTNGPVEEAEGEKRIDADVETIDENIDDDTSGNTSEVGSDPQDSEGRFEQLKIGELKTDDLTEYEEDVWVLSAEPFLYASIDQRDSRWIQVGYGLSLERYYKRFHYRLGLSQFKRIFGDSQARCVIANPTEDASDDTSQPSCIDLVPDSILGFYVEAGARHSWRKFSLNYAGGLEINRYDFDFDSQSEASIRLSTRASYRFAGYGLGVGIFSSLSARRFAWGLSANIFFLY